MRHAIHVTFGGTDLQPLTLDEFSLVEGLISGSFSIPSTKEARTLLKGAMSSSQKENKRKRQALLDTRAVDDPEGYRQSKAEAAATQTRTPPVSTSIELSPAKSAKKAKSRLSEDEGNGSDPTC